MENYIIRKSNNLSKQTQIIAANIDYACLVISLVNPRTSTGFIDRFLLCTGAYHIPTCIIFNKIDLSNNLDRIQDFKTYILYYLKSTFIYYAHASDIIRILGFKYIKILHVNNY